MSDNRSTAGNERRQLALTTVGFSLFYAVCVSFFYSTWLLGRADFSTQDFDNVLNPAMFVAAAIFALLVGRTPAVRRSLWPIAGHIALVAAVALLFASVIGAGPAFLALVAAGCAGAGMSLVAPFFFEALACFAPRQVALACGVMSLAGMALDIAWSALPPAALLIAQLASVAGSALGLARATRQEGAGARRDGAAAPDRQGARAAKLGRREFLNVFLVSGVGTFALSVVYGIIDTAATGAGPSPELSTGISKTGGIVAAVAFALYFTMARRRSATLLFNVVFGVLATGILFLPFLPGNYTVALNIFAAAGWKLVMLSLFYLVVIVYAHDRARLLAAIALAYALPRLGLFIGLNVARVFSIGDGSDFVRTTAVAFFLLYLILMVVWLVNAHERRSAIQQARAARERLDRVARNSDDVRRARCRELAAEHGLTNRETDILELLAQGRDAQFVSEALFLSRHTVKSYQKSIYAKLGVHSKQEVIDLAGATGLAERS